mgnify:CR=1 FL=1
MNISPFDFQLQFTFATDAMAELETLQKQLAADHHNTAITDKITACNAVIDAMDAYNMDTQIKKVLNGMGFPADTWKKKAGVLSGGEQTRLRLARLLLERPDILILDEPTNHLDLETMDWLETYLKAYRGAVLVVSHDRYFLDRVVDKLFTLEKGTWDRFYGDYSEYLEEKYSHHQEKKSEKPVSPSITKTNITPTKAKAGLTSRQEEELRRITEELPRYEAMLKGLNAAIAAAGSNYEEVESLLAEQKETQDKVDTLTERWCELEDLKS